MSHEVVYSYEELMNALFKSEEGETVVPKPSTFVLFTQDEHEGKKTINDVICAKGEAAVIEYLEQFSPEDIRLVIFKLNIINAEAFVFHPHIRLKEYPTLLAVDGSRRLEGCDVANEKILNLFFEQLDVVNGRTPSYRIWFYPPLIRTLDLCKNYWKKLGDEDYLGAKFENPEVFPGKSFGEVSQVPEMYKMPEDLNFWDVVNVIKKKVATQLEINSIAQGLDMKSKDATKLLEGEIRKRFRPENINPECRGPLRTSYAEMTEDISAETPIDMNVPSELFSTKLTLQQEDEPIIAFDLDALYLKKETTEIEREQKVLPPAKKDKKGKKKGKKKGGKKKGKGKDKKGKGKKGKGKKKGK